MITLQLSIDSMSFQFDYPCCHAMIDLVPYISCNGESNIFHQGKILCELIGQEP